MEHAHWAVTCKTAGCGINLVLEYLGIYDPNNKVPTLLEGAAENFVVHCGACREKHTYRRDEIRLLISPQPLASLYWKSIP
jgi:hypothetical protein